MQRATFTPTVASYPIYRWQGVGGVTGMTRIETDRQKRQMNRRIREVLALRRMMRTLEPMPEEPPAER